MDFSLGAAGAGLVLAGVWLSSSRSAVLPVSRPVPRAGRALVAALAGVGLVIAGKWWGLRAVVAGLVVVVGVSTARRLLINHRQRALAETRQEQVSLGCEIVANQLRLGVVPGVALERAANEVPLLERAHQAWKIGASIPDELRRLSLNRGCADLSTLAIAWQCSEISGASLAVMVDEVHLDIYLRQQNRSLQESELANARLTGRILAGLPAVGMVMSAGIGGDPLRFLTSTTPGLICVAGAVLLTAAGLIWTERIVEELP